MKRLLFLFMLTGCAASSVLGQIDSLAIKSGQGLYGIKNEALTADSLIVIAYQAGTPFSGGKVNFAFGKVPRNASGHSLSAASDLTNASGEAGITVTHGNKLGAYQVEASAGGDTVTFNLNVFRLKKTVLKLQREMEALINENIKLIVMHESGIGTRFVTRSGKQIPLSAKPSASQKTTIRAEFKTNNDKISSNALRLKAMIP
ncbi:MAG: hypothetical protein ACE5I1_17085 [bacterium]